MKKILCFRPVVLCVPVFLLLELVVTSATVSGQTVYYRNNFEDGNLNAEIGTAKAETGLGVDSRCEVANNPAPDAVNSSAKVYKSMAGRLGSDSRARAELSSQRIPTDEKVHTYKFQVYVPNDYFTGVGFTWGYVSQFKTYPCEKNAGYNICSEGGGIFNDITFNSSNFNFRYRANPSCYTATPSLDKGRWMDFRMEIYWTKTLNGYVKLYKNGSLVYDRANMRTLFTDWTSNCNIYWAMGQYTNWSPNGTSRTHQVMYFDNIEVFEGSSTPPPTTANLALNRPATASAAQTGNGPEEAVDGIEDGADNRWAAQNYPQSIQVDLGATRTVTGTEIISYQSRGYQYKVELSTDGSTYTLAVDQTAYSGGNAAKLSASIASQPARYVKFTFTGCSGSNCSAQNWISVNEIKVLGTSAARMAAPSEKPSALRVYPNPGSGRYQVNGVSTAKIQVFDLSGRLVTEHAAKNGSAELRMEEAPAGVYVVKDGHQTMRLLHQKGSR